MITMVTLLFWTEMVHKEAVAVDHSGHTLPVAAAGQHLPSKGVIHKVFDACSCRRFLAHSRHGLAAEAKPGWQMCATVVGLQMRN